MANVTSCENGLLEYELCRKPVLYLHHREIRWTATGSGVSAFLGSGFDLIFGQIVPIRGQELSNTNLVASNPSKSQKASLPVEVRRVKRLCLSSQ